MMRAAHVRSRARRDPVPARPPPASETRLRAGATRVSYHLDVKLHLHLKFRTRILLALILVGVAPLVLASALAYRANRDEVLGAVGRAQAQSAQDLARECEQFVLGAVDHLSASAGYLPLAQLQPDQVRDVLGIPFRQLRWVNALVLLSERGTAVGAPLFEAAPAEGAPPSQREPIGAEDLDAFSGSIPLATALASDVAIGQPDLNSPALVLVTPDNGAANTNADLTDLKVADLRVKIARRLPKRSNLPRRAYPTPGSYSRVTRPEKHRVPSANPSAA